MTVPRHPSSGRAFAAVHRLAGDRKAVTAIEFSLLAAPFALIVFAILGTGLIFLGELALDNAVAKGSRRIRTGEVAKSAMTEADFRKALCDETYSLFDCSSLKIDVRSYASYADLPKGAPLTGSGGKKSLNTAGFGYSAGTPNTIMAVQVYYEWPILVSPLQSYLSNLGNGSYLLGSIAAFKTEPFNDN